VLGSRILGFRVSINEPVPSSFLDISSSFCLEIMMVFLRVLVGVSSSELCGSGSESQDTGLGTEEC